MAAPPPPAMLEEVGTNTLPVKHLQFRAVPPLQLEDEAPKHGSLVACNKYGIAIVTMDRHLYFLRAEEFLEGKLTKFEIPSHRPSVVAFSVEEDLIALDKFDNDQLLICPTSAFVERHGEVEALCSMQIPSGVKRVFWSPADKNRLAVLSNDSSFMIFEIVGVNNFVSHKAPFKDITCACWSPKGKQIVVGRLNGSFCQLKLDLTIAKNIDGVGLVPHDIFWDTPKNFLIFAQQGGDYNFVTLDLEQGKGPHYRNYGDVFLSDEVDVPRCFFIKLGDSVICACSTSNEVLVFGKGADGLWKLLDLDDNTRACLPFGQFAIAASPFLASQKEIVTSTEPLPPAPIILFLAHQTLLPFHFVDSQGKFTPTASRPYVPRQQSSAGVSQPPSFASPPIQPVQTPVQKVDSTLASAEFKSQSTEPRTYSSPVQSTPVSKQAQSSLIPFTKLSPSQEEVDEARAVVMQMANEDPQKQESYEELISQIEAFEEKLNKFKSEDSATLLGKIAEYEDVQKCLATKIIETVKFMEGIGEASATLLSEVAALKSRIFSKKAEVSVTKLKIEMSKDPEYMSMLRSQKITPQINEKLMNIERLFNYVKKQIREVRNFLYFEKQKALGPTVSFKYIFITLDNHAKVINSLSSKINNLKETYSSHFEDTSLKLGQITSDMSQISLRHNETNVEEEETQTPVKCAFSTDELNFMIDATKADPIEIEIAIDSTFDQTLFSEDTEQEEKEKMKISEKINSLSLINKDESSDATIEAPYDEHDQSQKSASSSPLKQITPVTPPTPVSIVSNKGDGPPDSTPQIFSQQASKPIEPKPLFSSPPIGKDLFKAPQPLFESKGLFGTPATQPSSSHITITPIGKSLPTSPSKEALKTSLVVPQPLPVASKTSPLSAPSSSQDFGSGDLLKHLLTTTPSLPSIPGIEANKPPGVFQFTPSLQQKTPVSSASTPLFQQSFTGIGENSVFSPSTTLEVKEKANEEKSQKIPEVSFSWIKPNSGTTPSLGAGDTASSVSLDSKAKSESSPEISKTQTPSFASSTSGDLKPSDLDACVGISNQSKPSFSSTIGDSFLSDKGRLSTIQEGKTETITLTSLVSGVPSSVGSTTPLFQSTPKVDSNSSSSSTVTIPSGLFSLSFINAEDLTSSPTTVSTPSSTDPASFSFTVPKTLNSTLTPPSDLDSTLKNTTNATLISDKTAFSTLGESTLSPSFDASKTLTSPSATLSTPGLFQSSTTFGSPPFSGFVTSSSDNSSTAVKSMFGQTVNAPVSPPSGLFGSSTPGFQSPSFQTQQPKTETFGSSLFGSSPFSSPSKFGSSSVFGGDAPQSPTPFGQQPVSPKSPTSTFGAFGQQTQSQSAFGSSGSTSLFGASSFSTSPPPATNVFGSNSVFGGASQSPSTFGSTTQTTSSGFGAFGQQQQQPQQQQSIFGGQSKSPFGGASTGQQQQADSIFGSAFSGLGSTSPVSNTPDRNVFGGGPFGSNTSSAGLFGSSGGSAGFQSPTSFQSSPPKQVSSGFGAPAVFGGSPFSAPASSSFGSTSGSIFGGSAAQQSASTFGAIAQKSFGSFDQASSQSSPPTFGGSSVFGGNTFQTGASQNTFGGGSSIFGGGATQQTTTFGAVSQQAPQSTFGSFGQQQQQQQQQQQPNTFGGQPVQSQGSSFGGNSFSSWR